MDAIITPPSPIQLSFWSAVRNGMADILRDALLMGADPMLSEPGDGGALPIHRASGLGNRRCLDLLFASGVPASAIEALDDGGCSPLFYASSDLFRSTSRYAKANATNPHELPIFLLLSMGSNANLQDLDGETPLHQAVSTRFFVAAQTLLTHGADPRIASNDNVTPQALAALEGPPSMTLLLNAAVDAVVLKECTPKAKHALSGKPRI